MDTNIIRQIWAIDPVHSRIRFEAKYLLISAISGWFTDFEGTVTCDGESFVGSEVRLAIYTNSVNTGNEERDGHLRSADFLDARQFPVIGFHSLDVLQVSEGQLKIDGLLSIREKQLPLELKAKYLGSSPDPMGNTKAGFSLEAAFSRKEFGIDWNQSVGLAGWLISDEIRLYVDIQLLRLTQPA